MRAYDKRRNTPSEFRICPNTLSMIVLYDSCELTSRD